MPVRRLPKALVERLRHLVEAEERKAALQKRGIRTYGVLGRSKNIDYRKDSALLVDNYDLTRSWGYRVRVINVSHNFPRIGEVVIKRVHVFSAQITIDKINEIVSIHNKKYSPENYILLKPNAFAIGDDLVAMAKTNAPSVGEILGFKNLHPTIRGEEGVRIIIVGYKKDLGFLNQNW